MTPGTETETLIIGLIIAAILPYLIVAALFISRIWKVNTSPKPKHADRPKGEREQGKPVPDVATWRESA
jgi:hypothetical protein